MKNNRGIIKITIGFILVLFIGIIAFIIFSKNDIIKNTNANIFPNQCNISYIGNKAFELDDETSYLTSYIQFINRNDSLCYFSFINEYNNSIYFYNYDNSAFIKKIQYEEEGNNGVGKIQGYYYINEDNIYTFDYGTSKIFVTNGKSTVIKSSPSMYESIKYQDVSEIISFPPAPYVQTDNPIRVVNDYIILGGFFSGEYLTENKNNRPVNILYNLKTDKIRYLNNYPEMYQKYNLGGRLTYRLPHFEVREENLLLSFSADHYIQNYSFQDDSCTSHYAGSSFIKEIKAFPYPKSIPINKKRAWDWYMNTPSYEGIYYDKYNKLYYRIARLPDKDYAKHKLGNRKPIVIIVLDSQLNYLGEGKLPTDLNLRTTNCFVSEDGLNIQLLNEDENHFTFCQFKININNK